MGGEWQVCDLDHCSGYGVVRAFDRVARSEESVGMKAAWFGSIISRLGLVLFALSDFSTTLLVCLIVIGIGWAGWLASSLEGDGGRVAGWPR